MSRSSTTIHWDTDEATDWATRSDAEEDLASEVSSEEERLAPATPSRKKNSEVQKTRQTKKLIVQTAFDAYFTQISSRAQTSSSVFSALVSPPTAEEYAAAISSALPRLNTPRPIILSGPTRDTLFARYLRELEEGFNLLFYGLGSKREVLNQFATHSCAKAGHVVVVNGFQPDFALKDMLAAIERVPGVSELPLSSMNVDNQARRIYDFFADSSTRQHLYLVIHNIDSSGLRNSKAKSLLSLLALNIRIHIVASIDHISAPLLWTSSELSTRKSGVIADDNTPSRGFAWLWHDLTTLASYDMELAFADRTSISGAHGGGSKRARDANVAAAQSGALVSETAAQHILASVTQKAKKLFKLMGTQQLARAEEAGDTSANDLQQHAIGYDVLFNTARDNFVATNDTALRSLLGEFRDHGLVLATQSGSAGEVLWIPMRKERLSRIIQTLEID